MSITLQPKTILQTTGCGLVNGPFGNVSTDIIRKKKITHNMPAHMLSSTLINAIDRNIYSHKKYHKQFLTLSFRNSYKCKYSIGSNYFHLHLMDDIRSINYCVKNFCTKICMHYNNICCIKFISRTITNGKIPYREHKYTTVTVTVTKSLENPQENELKF
ncbi:hypothetical protein V1478_013669 [Vespula squamosa]|uniref:Uncharacterized protein n=1 Tax=Vespula squamosa TaxID=30214 RepID=A0ABD2A5T0_VESSQ